MRLFILIFGGTVGLYFTGILVLTIRDLIFRRNKLDESFDSSKDNDLY